VGVLDTGDRISDASGKFDPTAHGLALAAALGESVAEQEVVGVAN
jgi:hypothetical protein